MRAAVTLSILLAAAAPAVAQDPFEIQVYEYPTVPPGRWNLETHVNHVGRGDRTASGGVAPMDKQTHLTFELTRGITEHFELAGYLAFAHRKGGGAEFAAWRVRPRVRAPERWNLPVGLSLSFEVAFPTDAYDENAATLEVRPIIERRFGRLLVDVNPVIGRSLSGPGTSEGWDMEPGARVGYTLSERYEASIEYYGSLGEPGNMLPGSQQVHQFFVGGDVNIRPEIIWNLGLGLGATGAGNTLVYKMRLGWMF